MRRILINYLGNLVNRLHDKSVDIFDELEKVDNAIDRAKFAITNNRLPTKKQLIKSLQEIIDDTAQDNYIIINNELTYKIGGLSTTGITIVCGRPGDGKTSFMIQMAYTLAKRGHGVCFISLEMPEKQIIAKFMAQETGLTINKIVKKDYRTDEEHNRLLFASDQLTALKLLVCDNVTEINAIISQCVKIKKRDGISIFFIDYLQIISNNGRFNSRNHEIENTMKLFREAEKKYALKFIIGSQLSRASDGAVRYTEAHLRDSGAIEQDAYQIIAVNAIANRPDIVKANYKCLKYGNCELEQYDDLRGYTIVEMLKNRGGVPYQTGILKFTGESQVYTDVNSVVKNYFTTEKIKIENPTLKNGDIDFF